MSHTPSVPDPVLIARVMAGDDRHAFAELVRRHQSAVRSLLRRLNNGDAAFADDLAQETFIHAYKKLRQFRGDAKFSTWIYRIAYNVFLSHARSGQAHVAGTEEPLTEAHFAEQVHPSPGTGTALKLDMEKAMKALSEGERAAVIQCYFHDLSHEEAAYVLDCPLGTVKTNVLRARQKLKTLLSAWAPATSE